MNVFAYLRVSTNEQLTGGGFDRQLEACQKFCESRGWKIIRAFEESQSGSDEYQTRPKLLECLTLASQGVVDTIVVERADRIARDLIVSELFYREARKLKVKIYSSDYAEELSSSNGNETQVLIRQILAALSQWEKSMIVKKLTAGRHRKKSETGIPCGGPRPFGYRTNEWNVVRVALEEFRAGKPLLEICRILSKLTRENPIQYPKALMKRAVDSRRTSWFWHHHSVNRIVTYWSPRVNSNLDRPLDIKP